MHLKSIIVKQRNHPMEEHWLSRHVGVSSRNGSDRLGHLWSDVSVGIAVLLVWRQ